jgi:NADH-quinone oxidoreductase subunit N
MDLTGLNVSSLLPELVIAGGGLLVLAVSAFSSSEDNPLFRWISLLSALIAGFFCIQPPFVGTGYFGSAIADPLAFSAQLVILIVVALLVIGGGSYLRQRKLPRAEFYSLTLFAACGMLAVASAGDLIILFLGIEVLSISLYSMAGLLSNRVGSREAAIKYFLTGSFASAFLLFGMALIFGVSGSTNLLEITEALKTVGSQNWIVIGGSIMMLIGFLFKIGAVPFHSWAPDVYQGSPTIVTAFMSTAAKAAAFAGFGRIVLPLAGFADSWAIVLVVSAALTMVIGNFSALAQSNVKRMLAWSSVAHAGYLLLGILAASINPASLEAVIFYLLPYALINVCMFLVASHVSRESGGQYKLDDYKGLASRNPILAAVVAVCVFALAGIPPTAGFMGKFYVFSAAVNAEYTGLAILGVLTSVVSVFYYIRLIVLSYFHDPVAGNKDKIEFSGGLLLTSIISVIGILLLGIWPNVWLNITRGIGL